MNGVPEAEQVLRELRTALAAAGITLPSLRLDPVTAAQEPPAPLLDLGRCNQETARRLADALAARPDGAA